MSSTHTTQNPTTESPSTSETSGEDQYPKDSTAAAEIPDQQSKIGQTKGSAEEAAEKLYEERIEEEYAKREGGA